MNGLLDYLIYELILVNKFIPTWGPEYKKTKSHLKVIYFSVNIRTLNFIMVKIWTRNWEIVNFIRQEK